MLLLPQGRSIGGDGGGSFQCRMVVQQRARGGNTGAGNRESVKKRVDSTPEVDA